MDEDFAWLESLGLPNPEGLRFARVVWPSRIEGREARYLYGFVSPELELPLPLDELPDDPALGAEAPAGAEKGILTLDLQWIPLSLVRRAWRDALKDAPVLEGANLQKYGADLVSDSQPGRWRRSGVPEFMEESRFPHRSHFFIVSWLLNENGFRLLASEVYEKAAARPLWYPRPPGVIPFLKGDPEAESLREVLLIEFSRALYFQALERFVGSDARRSYGFDPGHDLLEFDPREARARLLADFEELLRRFPDSAEHAAIEHFTPILRKMVAEDRERPPMSLAETRELPPALAIDEWIFRLRDSLHVSRSTHHMANPVYEALIEAQPESIPRLIEAIDDERVVRCLANHDWSSRIQPGPPRLYTVGDVAAALLRRISDEEFFAPADSVSDWAASIEFRKELKRKATAWWETVQRLGEEEYLLSVVVGGGSHGASLLRRLRERHPDRFAEGAVAGLKATGREQAARLKYVEALSRIEGPEIEGVLREEMQTGPEFQARLASAKALFRRGFQEEAVEAMLEEWGERALIEERQVQPGIPDLPRLIVIRRVWRADADNAEDGDSLTRPQLTFS